MFYILKKNFFSAMKNDKIIFVSLFFIREFRLFFCLLITDFILNLKNKYQIIFLYIENGLYYYNISKNIKLYDNFFFFLINFMDPIIIFGWKFLMYLKIYVLRLKCKND